MMRRSSARLCRPRGPVGDHAAPTIQRRRSV